MKYGNSLKEKLSDAISHKIGYFFVKISFAIIFLEQERDLLNIQHFYINILILALFYTLARKMTNA